MRWVYVVLLDWVYLQVWGFQLSDCMYMHYKAWCPLLRSLFKEAWISQWFSFVSPKKMLYVSSRKRGRCLLPSVLERRVGVNLQRVPRLGNLRSFYKGSLSSMAWSLWAPSWSEMRLMGTRFGTQQSSLETMGILLASIVRYVYLHFFLVTRIPFQFKFTWWDLFYIMIRRNEVVGIRSF